MPDKKRESREPREKQPRVARRAPSVAELTDLKNWLSTLAIGVAPSVKVNGPHCPTALVVVDLGQPLKQIRLTSEQSTELGQRLRRTAREIIGRDASIRVSADNSHGIHWASVSA
jgi:hypothetical protein